MKDLTLDFNEFGYENDIPGINEFYSKGWARDMLRSFLQYCLDYPDENLFKIHPPILRAWIVSRKKLKGE